MTEEQQWLAALCRWMAGRGMKAYVVKNPKPKIERETTRLSTLPRPREFWECAECRAKPGSPTLCASCQHNRSAINELWTYIEELQERK